MWYESSHRGWGSKAIGRNTSIVDADLTPTSPMKPNAGRIIRIVNNLDPSVQCRVLLNLRTSQPFEEVLEDLGQVLKMVGTKRMYTPEGDDVYSFSQLRNEFAGIETFYLDIGPRVVSPMTMVAAASPLRRSRSSNGFSTGIVHNDVSVRPRARSKSRPRILYAGDSEKNGGKCPRCALKCAANQHLLIENTFEH